MYEVFEQLLQKNDVTPYKVAKEAGVTQTALSNWKSGRSTPATKTLQKIADYFGVTIDFLMTGENETQPTLSNIYPIELKRFPLLGNIACGIPKYTNEDRESYVMAGTDIKADFCLRASGDSMVNARILDGDIVFIRKQDMVENGEIAAVVVNNESEATLKRLYYYKERATLILKAENPAYEDLIFQNEELNEVHILGKAVAFQSDVI
ncbi:MAG: helix-turn-helix domain-containing protein [Dorea sp.]|jgi:repressor LexA|nr:helix-turn-helix domain-containing protein [Dorea sp.]